MGWPEREDFGDWDYEEDLGEIIDWGCEDGVDCDWGVILEPIEHLEPGIIECWHPDMFENWEPDMIEHWGSEVMYE